MRSIAMGGVLAAIAGAGLWMLMDRGQPAMGSSPERPTDSQHQQRRPPAIPPPGESSGAARTPTSAPPGDGPPGHDYGDAALARALAEATDYRAFVGELLDAAGGGHPGAQYFIYEALNYCDMGYRFYFDRPPRRRTIDEALQWASTRPMLRIDEVHEVYDRCRTLKESDASGFGTATEWLQKASAAGHALAQVTAASQLLLKATLAGYAEAHGSRTPSSAKALENDALVLIREALQSKQPGVLWQMGEIQGYFEPDPTHADRARLAWFLVACRRGYECGESSPWYRTACFIDPQRSCRSGEDLTTLIKREAYDDFPEIEQLAKQIDDKLDRNAFDELGLPQS